MWKGISSLIILVVAFTAFAGVAWFLEYYGSDKANVVQLRETGEVVLSLGEVGRFKNISITPLEVVEDSRCPVGVQCIWAGTLKLKVLISSGLGVSESVIELGGSITTEAEEVRFLMVTPKSEDYKFTFEVLKRFD
jgi:hypothetical protein